LTNERDVIRMLKKMFVVVGSVLAIVALSGCTFLPHIPDILGVPDGGTITLWVKVTGAYKSDFRSMIPEVYDVYFSGYTGWFYEIHIEDEEGNKMPEDLWGCMVWPGDHPEVFAGKWMLVVKAKVFHATTPLGILQLVTFPQSVIVFQGAPSPGEVGTPITV